MLSAPLVDPPDAVPVADAAEPLAEPEGEVAEADAADAADDAEDAPEADEAVDSPEAEEAADDAALTLTEEAEATEEVDAIEVVAEAVPEVAVDATKELRL